MGTHICTCYLVRDAGRYNFESGTKFVVIFTTLCKEVQLYHVWFVNVYRSYVQGRIFYMQAISFFAYAKIATTCSMTSMTWGRQQKKKL